MVTDAEFAERLTAVERLTRPGGRFETEPVDVRGVTRRNYVRRPLNLVAMFDAAVDAYPDRVAVIDGSVERSFVELRARAERLAAALQSQGTKPGDRVGILGANSAEWIEAFWGCAIGGFISVPLNALWSADELAYAIGHSGMRVCLVDDRRYDVVRGHADLSEDLWLPLGDVPGLAMPEAAEPFNPVPIAEGDGLSLFYTSGTTGRPKGALIDHRGIVANLQNLVYFTIRGRILSGVAKRDPSEPRPHNLSLLAVPLFHVTGCHASMVVSLTFGNTVVLYPPRAFDAEVAMELIERHRVTSFVGVPTLVQRILDAPSFGDHDLSSLRTIGFGGAAVSPDLALRTKATFGHLESFSNGYGLTETNAAVIGNCGAEYERRPDSVGKPAPNVDVRTVDSQGDDVPTGARGEIVIAGPMLMAGYWNDVGATEAAIVDGWFHTGDVGIIDAEGYVMVVDRIKDVVIRGGENVYSAEVEHALESHPDVVEAAVIGVPDSDLGERVKAVVVLRSDVGADTLAEYCRGRLARFKVPEMWELRTEPLPRNAAGKVLKPALRED